MFAAKDYLDQDSKVDDDDDDNDVDTYTISSVRVCVNMYQTNRTMVSSCCSEKRQVGRLMIMLIADDEMKWKKLGKPHLRIG